MLVLVFNCWDELNIVGVKGIKKYTKVIIGVAA
jgi:hypothetical protein